MKRAFFGAATAATGAQMVAAVELHAPRNDPLMAAAQLSSQAMPEEQASWNN